MKRVKVLKTSITTGSYQEFTQNILKLAEEKKSSYVCFANVHMTVEAHKDAAFNRLLDEADMVTPDGAPLSVAMRLLYGFKQDRVAGMDMFPTLIQEADKHGKSIYLYGGTQKVLDAIIDRAEKEHPGLKIAGAYSPPFRKLSEEEQTDIINMINDAKPDLVFVALGCPKQEKWVAAHKGKIRACLLAVGGAFPVYAELQERAPAWMQKYSLEWFHRLMKEPRRLFKRYFVTNSIFLALFLKSFIFSFGGISTRAAYTKAAKTPVS